MVNGKEFKRTRLLLFIYEIFQIYSWWWGAAPKSSITVQVLPQSLKSIAVNCMEILAMKTR